MAVPVVESVASVANATAATTHTVTKPTGVANDDVLLISMAADAARTITVPTGFTEIINQSNGSAGGGVSITGAWAYKVVTDAGSEPADYDFTLNNSDQACGAIRRISGVNTADVVDVSDQSSGNTSGGTGRSCPTVTTTNDDALVIRDCAAGDDRTFTFPAGTTQRFDLDPPDHVNLMGADESQVTAGATGTALYTFTPTTSVRLVCATIALNAAPAAGGGAPMYAYARRRAL